MHGITRKYNELPDLKLESEEEYKDNILQTNKRYINDKLSYKKEYKNGDMQIYKEYSYINGKKHTTKTYDKNGKLSIEEKWGKMVS